MADTDNDIDLTTLNPTQVLSHCEGLRVQIARLDKSNTAIHLENDRLQKQSDELTSTCEAQYRTISEQSETLENRQKLVDESQSAYTELLDQSVKEIDSLRQANESIAGPEPGEVAVGELCDALEDYGLNCARVAANDVHNAVAVAFIQISTRIKNEGWTWQQALSWFSTGK